MATATRNALGKGISALIPSSHADRPGYFLCPLHRIRAMHQQPRTRFDDESLEGLARSIQADGVLQPIVVRRDGADYTIIAGERRWRAAHLAGLRDVPVVLKETTERDAFAMALVENLQREDLRPLEVAEACRRLVEEHGMTQDEVAQRIGKSRSAVANTLRLLKLAPASQDALAEGQLSEGHARQLVGLSESEQLEVVREVVDNALSVRETEARVRALKGGPAVVTGEAASPATPSKAIAAPARVSSAERVAADEREPEALREAARQLQAAFGARVRIKDRDGSGTIELSYDSYDAFSTLVERLLATA